MKKSFGVNSNKGFHITFPNGITLSTQFGGGNYCENYDYPIGEEIKANQMNSDDAEIAIWNKSGKWRTEDMMKELFKKEYSDDVMGRVSIAKWLKIFQWCKNQK